MSVPIFSVEAEQALLGALMLDPSAADRIEASLVSASFYREDHGRIWAVIQRLRGEGKPHDSLSVCDALGGDLERCGGLAYVVELEASTASSAGIKRHAEIVAERAMRRAAMAVSAEIAEAANDPQRSAREVVDLAQARVMALGQQASQKFTPVTMREALSRTVKRLQARIDGRVEPGLATGFVDLDRRMNGGLRAGQLIVLAARPAMGKTSLAVQIAAHAALHGTPALVCSQEMAEAELMDRMVALRGRIPLSAVLSGQMSDDEWSRVTAASGELLDAPLCIDEQPALNLLDVRSKVRKVARECGRLGLLVIDYLQLMVGDGANRNAEIEQISRGLKQLAKELGVPVIALSQLSRKCEERPNKRPMASDLRDSGAIEQDADVILSLYRDEVYNPDSPHKGTAELGVIKCRNGRSGGFVPLTFIGEFTRFESFAGEWAAEQQSAGRQGRRRAFDD